MVRESPGFDGYRCKGISPAMLTEIGGAAPITDEQVVRRVVDGDTSAFEILMRRHNQRLFRLARSVVGEDTEAEEVVQESFVRAYAALPKFEGRSSFVTWVSRIAYHEALRSRRKRIREKRVAVDLDTQPASSATDESGEGAMGVQERRTLVSEAFERLSTPHRTVIMLRLIEGLSTRETSVCMRTSEGNVKVLLHRAKAQLGEHIHDRSISHLRDQFSFAELRCDRIVARVFTRIAVDHPGQSR